MNKLEMIESLQKMIDCLKGDVKPKPRYELRYWDSKYIGSAPTRSDEPVTVYDNGNKAEAFAKELMERWCNVELYEATQDKMILRYKESKD